MQSNPSTYQSHLIQCELLNGVDTPLNWLHLICFRFCLYHSDLHSRNEGICVEDTQIGSEGRAGVSGTSICRGSKKVNLVVSSASNQIREISKEDFTFSEGELVRRISLLRSQRLKLEKERRVAICFSEVEMSVLCEKKELEERNPNLLAKFFIAMRFILNRNWLKIILEEHYSLNLISWLLPASLTTNKTNKKDLKQLYCYFFFFIFSCRNFLRSFIFKGGKNKLITIQIFFVNFFFQTFGLVWYFFSFRCFVIIRLIVIWFFDFSGFNSFFRCSIIWNFACFTIWIKIEVNPSYFYISNSKTKL